jgi:hypothetical protein
MSIEVMINLDFDPDLILKNSKKNRAELINDLRHKGTNYDEVIAMNLGSVEYQKIAERARELVYELIEASSCSRFEKYLYSLYNKRWDFFKRSDILVKAKNES